MNRELITHNNQRGFAPVIIFAALAALIGAGVLAYSYFIAGKTPFSSQTEIPVMENSSQQTTVKVGSPQCPELDYTGCDTSQDWMTWKDDGVR